MRVFCIVGTQLRHQYFLSHIARNFDVSGVLFVQRSLVQPPKINRSAFSKVELDFEKLHLKSLGEQERRYFSGDVNKLDLVNTPVKRVNSFSEINAPQTIDWVSSLESDVMVDYGSGILSDEFLDALPAWRINLHGGLSPWYKGSATLLWPLYFQQPQLLGMTYHLLSKKIDGGDILHHSRPTMYTNDSATEIACRSVVQGVTDGIKLLNKIKAGEALDTYPQKSTGKLFLEKDYTPRHLGVVYKLLEEGMIQHYLDNQFAYESPYQFVNQVDHNEELLKHSA